MKQNSYSWKNWMPYKSLTVQSFCLYVAVWKIGSERKSSRLWGLMSSLRPFGYNEVVCLWYSMPCTLGVQFKMTYSIIFDVRKFPYNTFGCSRPHFTVFNALLGGIQRICKNAINFTSISLTLKRSYVYFWISFATKTTVWSIPLKSCILN